MQRTDFALGDNSLYSVKGGPSARRRAGRAAWRPVPARRDNTDHTAYEKAPDSTIRCPASQAVSSVPPPTRRSTAPPSTRWFSRATHPVSRTNTVRGHPLEGPEESRTEGVACSNHAEGTASDPRNAGSAGGSAHPAQPWTFIMRHRQDAVTGLSTAGFPAAVATRSTACAKLRRQCNGHALGSVSRGRDVVRVPL